MTTRVTLPCRYLLAAACHSQQSTSQFCSMCLNLSKCTCLAPCHVPAWQSSPQLLDNRLIRQGRAHSVHSAAEGLVGKQALRSTRVGEAEARQRMSAAWRRPQPGGYLGPWA